MIFFSFSLSTKMPEKSKLSSKEQFQILTLDQVGKSSREIANFIGRSKSTILNSPKEYRNSKRKDKKSKRTLQTTR